MNCFKLGFWEFLKKTFGSEGILSSWQERHAFLIGICETVAFLKPRWDMPPDYEAWVKQADTHKPGNPLYEYHYYMFGRACGVIFWLIVIAFFWKVIA